MCSLHRSSAGDEGAEGLQGPLGHPSTHFELGLYQVDAVTPKDVTAWAVLQHLLAIAWASPHLDRRSHFEAKQSLLQRVYLSCGVSQAD